MASGETVTKAGLARLYGVSVNSVDAWVRRGCPHERRKRAYAFDTAKVAAWRERRARDGGAPPAAPGRRRVHPEGVRWLKSLALSQDHLLPWMHDAIVPIDEYSKMVGLDHAEGELLTWLVYGFPILAPAEGEEVARVSVPHAERWRFLFAGFVEMIGGDGNTLELGSEANRLRGLSTMEDSR